MDVEIEHNEARGEFSLVVNGRRSFLRYVRLDEHTLDLRSTFVHPDLRGRGLGERLVRRALDHARERHLEVVPTCWFVETVVERHPGYQELIRP